MVNGMSPPPWSPPRRYPAGLADGSSVGTGSSLPGGVWTFDYEPKSPELFLAKDGTWLSGLDKTTVVMPGGKQVYYHYGFSYTGVPGSGILWAHRNALQAGDLGWKLRGHERAGCPL